MHSLLVLLRADPLFIFIVIGIVLAISAVGFYFSRKMVVLRNLRRAQGKQIRDFKDGDKGKISGHVVFAGETIYAPLTGRKCSYYYVLVEEYRSNGKSGSWHKIIEEERQGDVVLRDASGYAIIDTGKTMCYLVPDAKFESGSFNDPTPVLENYLRANNINPETWMGFNKKFRYREGILEKDEICTVSGEGQWNETKDHAINIPSPKVLVMTINTEEEKVYLTDDPEVAIGIGDVSGNE